MNQTQLRKTVFVLGLLMLVSGTAAPLNASNENLTNLTQGQNPTGPVAFANTAFTYQGRLTDGGSPANGVYDFQFGLYNTAAMVVAPEKESPTLLPPPIAKNDVTVTSGLFTVELDFGVSFTGEALYLEIAVRPGASTGAYTTLTPRQAIQATPYALSLVPGARIDGNQASDVFRVSNAGGGAIYGETTATSSGDYGVMGWAPSGSASGVYGQSDSPVGYGVQGLNTSTGTGVAGSGRTGVYGSSNSTSGWGVYGINNTTTGTNWGVYGRTDATLGRGVGGYAYAASGTTNGVRGESASYAGRGVLGYAYAITGTTYGVLGQSDSTSGYGVYGYATASSGVNYGTYGYATSPSGAGVGAYAAASSGSRNGVIGDVNGTGYGLYTNDLIYTGGGPCVGCAGALLAVNTSPNPLRVGDVVTINDVGEPLKGQSLPVLQIRAATTSDLYVLGVISSRGEFHAATSNEPLSNFDSVQPATGDVIAPGDYLIVVTSGLAQVRVGATAQFVPGQRLAVGGASGPAAPVASGASPALTFAVILSAKADANGLVWAMIEK